MNKFLSIFAILAVLLGGAGMASADIWDLTTSNSHQSIQYPVGNTLVGQYTPTYNVNYATKLIAGAYTSTGTLWTTGNEFNSYIDGNVKNAAAVPIGAWVLGSPDFDYGIPNAYSYEMYGGAAGMSPKSPYSATSWFVVGFDQPLADAAGNDLVVNQIGGWGGNNMEVFVSTNATYSSTGMTWYDLGHLTNLASKPSGVYGTAPADYFDFSSAGITGNVNYVMFVGSGHWVDAVGGSAVPVPAAAWLLGSGLLGLCGLRKRHSKTA
jgi:hypothetical protein